MADFPVVPIAPGVPPLMREPGSAFLQPELLTEDFLGSSFLNDGATWGLFQGGSPVLTPDSVKEFGLKVQFAIMDYPIEQGSFATYNKVAIPYDAKLRVVVAGSEEDRSLLLEQVDAISKTLELYDAVTPEKTYLNVNMVGYDYQRRSNNGVGMISIDVFLREVRVSAGVEAGNNTQSASGASTTNGGAPQTQDPNPAQSAAASGIRGDN